MTTVHREQLTSRDEILDLLTPDELAKVSNAEAGDALAEGSEYVDLEQLDLGIQHATPSSNLTMSHILPRESVSGATWAKIIKRLKS